MLQLMVPVDKGINKDGASFAANSHKSVDVPPKDWIRRSLFLPIEEE